MFDCLSVCLSVCRSPFVVSWAESIIAKTSNSVSLSLHTIWVGTISISLSNLSAEERQYLQDTLQAMDCVPVFLDDDVAEKSYLGFCKSILWPVFHNVDQLDQIHAAWNLPADYYEQHALQVRTRVLSTIGLFPLSLFLSLSLRLFLLTFSTVYNVYVCVNV
jgi:hypothetical protein